MIRNTLATLLAITMVLPAVTGCKTCAGGACTETPRETGKTFSFTQPAVISTETLQAMLAAKTPLVLLDARSGKYDDGSRIPGAKSLNAASKPAEIAAVVASKDTLVVTYCSNLKCPASNALAEHLIKLGYKNVLEYSAGIGGWVEAGLKVETLEK